LRLYCFDDYRLGVMAPGGGIVDVTSCVGKRVAPIDRMSALIEGWEAVRGDVAAAAQAGEALDIASVRVLPPQPRPSVIVAAPVNYVRHQQEMGGEDGVYRGLVAHTIETYGGFVKASSSVTGPAAAIELPLRGRRIDHEAELGVVIGRTAKDVDRREALKYVFGYLPLLDITLRGEEDRSYRKSFDTFTPIGPAIVTVDEVPDPGGLGISLTVNGQLRQHANTRDMIYGVPRLIELYSSAMTLRPGDIIATGTPQGVGPLADGDEVVLSIDSVGELTMPVTGPRTTSRESRVASSTIPL
jgi:2-keto-4-pentenoate hydratase/2-oxohepta-3-ene-1,7-dioic acid hydratase in catechol pathway